MLAIGTYEEWIIDRPVRSAPYIANHSQWKTFAVLLQISTKVFQRKFHKATQKVLHE